MQIDLAPGGNDLHPKPFFATVLVTETEKWEMPVSKVLCFKLVHPDR